VCRVAHFHDVIAGARHGHDRTTLPLVCFVATTAFVQLRHGDGIGNIPAFGIATLVPEEVCRPNDRFTGEVFAHAHHHVDRIFGTLFRRDAGVHELIYERTVGTVLQQAAHQVGQQILMSAGGRIDSARHLTVFQHLLVQGLAHTL